MAGVCCLHVGLGGFSTSAHDARPIVIGAVEDARARRRHRESVVGADDDGFVLEAGIGILRSGRGHCDRGFAGRLTAADISTVLFRRSGVKPCSVSEAADNCASVLPDPLTSASATAVEICIAGMRMFSTHFASVKRSMRGAVAGHALRAGVLERPGPSPGRTPCIAPAPTSTRHAPHPCTCTVLMAHPRRRSRDRRFRASGSVRENCALRDCA
jgi:hypothetical protein